MKFISFKPESYNEGRVIVEMAKWELQRLIGCKEVERIAQTNIGDEIDLCPHFKRVEHLSKCENLLSTLSDTLDTARETLHPKPEESETKE